MEGRGRFVLIDPIHLLYRRILGTAQSCPSRQRHLATAEKISGTTVCKASKSKLTYILVHSSSSSGINRNSTTVQTQYYCIVSRQSRHRILVHPWAFSSQLVGMPYSLEEGSYHHHLHRPWLDLNYLDPSLEPFWTSDSS